MKQKFHGRPVRDVARVTGLSYSTVWRHATGKRKMNPETAIQYEAALGIPRSELRPDLWAPEGQPSTTPIGAEAEEL